MNLLSPTECAAPKRFPPGRPVREGAQDRGAVRPLFATLALLVAGSSPARALSWFDGDRLALPCRPTVACTADIVPPGSFELEMGYLIRRLHDPAIQHSLPFLAKLTLWLHTDLNLGANLWRLEGPALLQPWAALALSVELPRHFTVMAENYFFSDASPLAPKDGGLLLALAYAPRPWIVVDVGGDLGYFPSQRSMSAFVGLTILPVAFWEPASEPRNHSPPR